ncbi:hypothetical protein GOB57_21930 [Sinorhizobium meliloti]|nr:hypothetical protein [Sinorhizobium meliloti]
MKVAFPSPYLDRLKTGESDLVIHLDDVVEHDVDEIRKRDAPVVISLRVPIPDHEDVPVELRFHEGKLLRSACYHADSDDCIKAENLPQLRDGRVIGFDARFLALLPGSQDVYLYNAVGSLLRGKSGAMRVRAALDDEFLVEWSRGRMRDYTQRALGRLKLLDGELWKETNWPRIRLFGTDALNAAITFDEDGEFVRSRYPTPCSGDRTLLLSQAHRIEDIAQELGIPLGPRTVVIDYISTEDYPNLNERASEAWRIADAFEHRVAKLAGEIPAVAIVHWLALREAVRERDANVPTDDILNLVFSLRDGLGLNSPDIVSEVDQMLAILDVEVPQSAGNNDRRPGNI